MPHTDLKQLFELVRAVAESYPAKTLADVVLRFSDGTQASFPVPGAPEANMGTTPAPVLNGVLVRNEASLTPTYPSPELKHIHRKLLQHATTTPVTSRHLIVTAGYKFNAHSRGALTYLCRQGLLVRDAWGRYALPPTTAPSPEVNGHAAPRLNEP